MLGFIISGIIIILIMVLVITNIRIVPQTEVWIIERLGTYQCSWKAGLHVKVPFIDSIAGKVSTKEKVFDFPPQSVITKDNVTMSIDTVVYAKVTDPKLYTYGTVNPIGATEALTATTLRNIVGGMVLDTTLTSRDEINDRMRIILDEATDAWGIKVIRVEVKNIQPPAEIKAAMDSQMKAEREKRASILEAEGQKRSAILIAEGKKEATILEAEAQKKAKILEAEAIKERKIREAEGEAEAIKLEQEAYASSIERLNRANASQKTLTLKAYDAMRDVANGNATKLIVPSDLADMSGFVAAIKESGNLDSNEQKGRKSRKSNIPSSQLSLTDRDKEKEK